MIGLLIFSALLYNLLNNYWKIKMEELINFLDLKNKNVLFVLDYDGTLTEIINEPMQAILTDERKKILEKLVSRDQVQLIINSGRPIEELLQVTGNIDVDFLGNHGLFFREHGSKQFIQIVDQNKLKKWDKEMIKMREFLKKEILPNFENAWIQENTHGFVLHTRKMDPVNKNLFIIELQNLFKTKFKKISYSTGKEIVEVKPMKIVNKAKGLEWYLNNKYKLENSNQKILCIGDDLTDEDMFELVNSKKNGISIKIDDDASNENHEDTSAKVILKSVDQLYVFLEEFNKSIS